MDGCRIAAVGGLLLVSQLAGAGQDVSGLTCTGGELSLTSGQAFSAMCTGDLRIDAASVIEAEESITLRAAGYLWMAGTLVAPQIVLTAGANLDFMGGLFSGSPDSLPEVRALRFAGSPAATLSVFSDLVPRPVIDPVYGALTLTLTLVEPLPMFDLPLAVMPEFILIPDETASPVPEPSHLALFAAGLGLIAWKRRAESKLSRTAHARSNLKATLEN